MYGIIDIGSNTIRLSVYKKTDDSFQLVFNKKNGAGLASYVNKDKTLSQEGINKAISVLKSFSQVLNNVEVKDVYVFATASLRNIANREYATRCISDLSGFDIDVISGEDEAMYDFVGATCFMKLDEGILIDIGGGSTELVVYNGEKIEMAISIPIGSLNMYKEYVSDILPSKKEMNKIKKRVESELEAIKIFDKKQIICGVGGTVRNSCKLGNAVYNLGGDNRYIDVESLSKLLKSLMEDRTKAIETIVKTTPDRIHTIVPGMAILTSVAKKYGSERVVVSEYGVREGYLYTRLFKGGNLGVYQSDKG